MPSIVLKSVLASAALIAVAVSGPASAAGLDCGKPPERHAQADEALSKVITSSRVDDDTNTALLAAARRLKSEDVSSGLIVDHAVAAYCPLVAKDDSLSLDQKREAVRRFASGLTSAVYDPRGAQQDETAVILSLPIKPALSREIDVAAATAGTTRDAWILKAVKDRLGGR